MADQSVTLIVVRIHGFLEPEHVVWLHLSRDLLSLVVTVGAVGIYHHPDVRPDRLAHHSDALHVFVDRRAADLHLHRPRAHLNRYAHLFRKLTEALAFLIVPTRDVHGHPIGESTEQLVHRQAGRLALEIPERDVDAADDAGRDATTSNQLRLPQVVPDLFRVERVLTDDHLGEVVENSLPDLLRALDAACQTDSGYALVGLDLDDVQASGRVHVHTVTDRLRPLPAIGFHIERCDLHGCSNSNISVFEAQTELHIASVSISDRRLSSSLAHST